MIRIVKFSASIVILLLPVIVWASCTTEETGLLDNNVSDSVTQTSELMKDTIAIIIGDSYFTAILESNAAVTEFKKMLPLTISMKDLNSNEKYIDLSKSLPTNASNLGKINAGDLLLYGSKTVVLFYEAFSTSYSYTRLGKINNPGGLEEALGSNNVIVTIELK